MRYFDELRRIATEHPGRPAICDDTRSLTYRELLERVEATAGGLAAVGVGPGARVGLTVPDEMENIVATLALMRAGAWQLTLASHDSPEVRNQLADRIRATCLIAAEGVGDVGAVATVRWPPARAEPPDGVETKGGLLVRTSGTTGESNIVPVGSDDIAVQAARDPEYRSGRHLRLASVEHNNSKRHRLYTLCMGATVVLRPQGALVLSAFCRQMAVSCIDMSIMHAVDLASRRTDLRGIDIRIGGSAAPHEVRKKILEHVSDRLHVRYGTTETGTIAICSPQGHDPEEPVGKLAQGITLEIVDEAGMPLPSGETGHIRVRGDGIARGYFGNEEQTARRFRDGWFWPGDIGLLRPDEILVVKGRADDMIILNGINIFPVELERVLQQHPGVAMAAAVGLPSLSHGQIPVAAVELVPGATVDERTLLGYAKDYLGLRAPRRIMIVSALPRSGQGKLLRRLVPALFTSARAQT